MHNCRGQSYDNAKNMSGKYQGLQILLQDGYDPDEENSNKRNKEKIKGQGISPFACFIPCAAHLLNLIGEAAAKCCPEAIAFFDFAQEVYNFFSRSTERWEELQNCQVRVNQMKEEKSKPKAKPLKNLSQTRWSSRSDACKSLQKSWDAVFQCLTDVENNKMLKSDIKNKATGLKKQMKKI